MSQAKLILLTLLFITALAVNSKKILLVQVAVGKSHMQFSGVLTDKLVDRGHIVDKLVLHWNPYVITNGTKKARRIISVTRPDSPYKNAQHIMNPFKYESEQGYQMFIDIRKMYCETLLANKGLIEELKSENYDIALVTPWGGCSLALTEILEIKSTAMFVATSNADYIFEGLGVPSPPSYLSYIFEPVSPGKPLNFPERVANYIKWFKRHMPYSHWNEMRHTDDEIVHKYYPHILPYSQLFHKVSYVFLNMNELLDIGQPISSKIKFIGGIHLEDGLTNTNLTMLEVRNLKFL
ncbi:unnamed protein product [Bursaphelenchus okinawaensis]|uniref:glucuronosyltransferase n=1 Tax=Bursaphelenchus okinawaensis TaxID=465554 RepID=A0A811K297_9BILA|nr:unnamed protein product [Bursaphelenchus okinawaensis]CAG9090409.1 unnamed protein product [Bursaphelenchus okinawaensis]